jgi:GNAT superfamily N-acetyltransferase
LSVFVVEKLARQHAVDAFDCGTEPLNTFLKRYALVNQQANASQTYVAAGRGEVIGYFTLVVGEVDAGEAPPRVSKGLARHAIPIMVLARLAVDKQWQGEGVGAGLMRDAIGRTLQAADIAGIRALVVHSKDDAARAFYSHFGFASGFSDPMHLYVLTKELKALLG